MTAFEPPAEPVPDADPEEAPRVSALVTLAGVVQIVAGACTAAVGLQLLVFVNFYSLLWLLPYVLLPLGLAHMALGALASRGQDWAAVAGAVLTWTLQVGALAWMIYSFAQGFFSLLTLVWFMVNGVASLVAPLGVPGALAVSRARRALYR